MSRARCLSGTKAFDIRTTFVTFTPFVHGPEEKAMSLRNQCPERLRTVGGNTKDTATVENSMVVPQRIENRIVILLSNSTFGYISKIHESRASESYLHPTCITALFTRAETGRQPKSPSTREWISKMRPSHTMEYYSAFTRKEILTYVQPEGESEGFVQSP